jgi:hypothetical protein
VAGRLGVSAKAKPPLARGVKLHPTYHRWLRLGTQIPARVFTVVVPNIARAPPQPFPCPSSSIEIKQVPVLFDITPVRPVRHPLLFG